MKNDASPLPSQVPSDLSGPYEAPFDWKFLTEILRVLYPVLNDVYFRSSFVGFEDHPERVKPEHPVILASNHSGMAFPWDAMVFVAGIIVNSGYQNHVRTLVSPMLTQTRLMNPYFFPDFWVKMGAIPATFTQFERMMHHPHAHVLIYPEGVPGIGKGFNRKYQIQRMATSFVRFSLKYQTDIVPFATVNAEYINPHSYSFNWVNRISRKFGIPFLPIGFLVFLIPFQPWIFYFALPAKLTFVRGKAIKPYEMTDKPYEALSRQDIEALRDRVHAQMQQELTDAAKQYGKRPYRWRELLARAWKHRKYFPFFLPFCWPLMFEEFHRRYRKGKDQPIDMPLNLWTFFVMLVRNPITFCYFLPLIGWIPLLIRGHGKWKKSGAQP